MFSGEHSLYNSNIYYYSLHILGTMQNYAEQSYANECQIEANEQTALSYEEAVELEPVVFEVA